MVTRVPQRAGDLGFSWVGVTPLLSHHVALSLVVGGSECAKTLAVRWAGGQGQKLTGGGCPPGGVVHPEALGARVLVPVESELVVGAGVLDGLRGGPYVKPLLLSREGTQRHLLVASWRERLCGVGGGA